MRMEAKETMIKYLTLRAAALAAACCFIAGPVLALDSNWVGGNGAWEHGPNWSTGVEPLAADAATITGSVEVSSSDTLNEAVSLRNEASLSIISGVLDILGLTENAGDLDVLAGTFESNFFNNEATGNVMVTGATSLLSIVVDLDNGGALTIENMANANIADIRNTNSMTIRSGGIVAAETMNNDIGSTLVVEDSVSDLAIEDNTTNAGTLMVKTSASFSTDSFVNYAGLEINDATFDSESFFNAALGVIDLTGASTMYTVNGNVTNQGKFMVRGTANADIVSIGNENEMTISDGGIVQTISILNDAAGVITIEDAGSRLILTDNLQSAGSVSVREGGNLTALSIGNSGSVDARTGASVDTSSISNTATGVVRVRDPDTAVVLDNNFDNAGLFEVFNQGHLESGSFVNMKTAKISTSGLLETTTLNNRANASLLVTDAQSKVIVTGVFENEGEVKVSNSAELSVGSYEQLSGVTELDNATILANGGGISIAGGELTGSGEIVGALSSSGSGTLNPGSDAEPIALWMVEGGLNLGGIVLIDIAGLANGDFDVISATDPAQLGGVLEVTLLDGFAPQIGDEFDIVLASLVSGTFATTIFPEFDGRTFELIVGADFARLTVTNVPLPGAIYFLFSGITMLLFRARNKSGVAA